MDRQSKLLLGLVAFLVLLVALDRYWAPDDPLGNPDATRLIWEVDAPDIRAIAAVHEDGRAVRLARVDEDWWVEAPFEGRANQRVASRMARVLGEIRYGEPLDEGEPEVFGLGEPPRARVTADLPSGPQEIVLGRTVPSGWRTYVRGVEGPAVIDGEIESSLFLEVDELRDRHLLHYDPATVRRVTIASESGTLAIAGEGREWWVEGYARADLDAIEQLLAGLLDLQVETFLDEAIPEGIGQPHFTVHIQCEGQEDIVVHVGEVTPLGRIVQVVGGTVGAVPAGALAVIGQSPVGLSDPHAIPVRQVRPRRVRVELGEDSWDVVFGPEGWERSGATVQDTFAAMETLRTAQTSPQVEPVPAITETFGSIILTDEQGGERRVDLGQLIEGRRVAVDRAGGEPYFVLEEGVQAIRDAFAGAP